MNSKSSEISFQKFLFMILTGILILFGLALVLIGTLLKTNYKLIIGEGMDMIIKRVPNSTVIIFIAVGAIILLVSVFGNCGSAMNDSRMLYSFAVINVLLLLVQFITIGMALRFNDQLEETSRKQISRAIKDYHWSENRVLAVDNLQNIFKCCGANQYNDWEVNQHFNTSQPLYPYSCCRHLKRHSSECNAEEVKHNIGCVDAISDKYRTRVYSLVGISAVICLVQIIVIVLAIKLATNVRHYETI